MKDDFSQKKFKVLTPEGLPRIKSTTCRDGHEEYYAMYSSVWDAIVLDPAFMMIPIDDHMVHRGDGVFEVFKHVNGIFYNLDAHLRRLRKSAAALELCLNMTDNELRGAIDATVQAGGRGDCVVRLFVSRGTGGFGANPYECDSSQLYIVVTELPVPFMKTHPQGARMASSGIRQKPPEAAGIKSMNYLVNVLMKKESIDKGVDFVAGFDDRGFLTEGATENIGIVTKKGELLFPCAETILPGTTMERLIELAETAVDGRTLLCVDRCDITREMMQASAEIILVETTINAVATVMFDGSPVGDGAPGPVYKLLDELLVRDMKIALRTYDG